MDIATRRRNFEQILENLPTGVLEVDEMLATFDDTSRYAAVEFDGRSESAWISAHPSRETALASFGNDEGDWPAWMVIDLDSGETYEVEISAHADQPSPELTFGI
jgi:hypothetical protein